MSTTRQDAWTQDEDLLLAEVVLRHIREGGTQLQAFEEVGKRLSRTAAACGFRWNSSIRKQYKTGIELAKKQRKEGKKGTVEAVDNMDEFDASSDPIVKTKEASISGIQELTFEDLLAYLNRLYDQARSSTDYQESLSLYEGKVKQLEQQIQDIAVENKRLEKE